MRPGVARSQETVVLSAAAAAEIMDLLSELHAEGMTLLVVTHDVKVAARADRVVFMIDGRVADDLPLSSQPDLMRPEAITDRMRQLGI